MKIKKILWQSRRDFYADYECEHCGYIKKNSDGYDDSYFHNTVIPNMICPKCNKKSDKTEATSKPKYSDDIVL